MFRLTRQVRFSINRLPDAQLSQRASNGFGGYPSFAGLGSSFHMIEVTLSGMTEPRTGYLRNIKEIDQQVRAKAIPIISDFIAQFRRGGEGAGFEIPNILSKELRDSWPGVSLDELRLNLTPFLSITSVTPEYPMIRLSQKFEFSASHRLHSNALSEEENRRSFGKCNNPHGHGHNYEVEVTLKGEPDSGGLVEMPWFERTVAETVIEPFDHKNLNIEVAAFADGKLIPSVENIAMVIYRMLKPKFISGRAQLASVTVWETPKTWCQYSE
jgi:6-pyruvoyltetrahydropterin/6-carboxytetrahydropterin synthase